MDCKTIGNIEHQEGASEPHIFTPLEEFTLTAQDNLPVFVRYAFSPRARKEIGRRDRWTCVECGQEFADGVMQHAAHYLELHQNGTDDNSDNGRILCVKCHLHEHIIGLQRDFTHSTQWHENSLRLLANQAFHDGLHTKAFYEECPEWVDIDRREVVAMLEYFGLDPREFINF